MIKIPVYLRDMYDAKHLVQAASGCQKDVELICGRYIVDAKSLLGLMNLGFDQKIELKVYDEECDDLWKELDKFVAAQGCSYVEKDGQ